MQPAVQLIGFLSSLRHFLPLFQIGPGDALCGCRAVAVPAEFAVGPGVSAGLRSGA